jgi:hypothetical protein
MKESSDYARTITGRLFRLLVLSSAFLFLLQTEARAQTPGLAEYYRSIWFQERFERLLNERGLAVAPFKPAHIHAESDSIRWKLDWRDRAEARRLEAESRFRMNSVQAVKRLERPVFEDDFVRIPRAYYGSNDHTPIDTTLTRELRARLEAAFGPPTRTVSDLYDHSRRRVEDFIQFEYWFVLNDSIPLIVMDVAGPLERGLVFATHASYRDMLPDLKRMFGRHVATLRKREAYADYFFNELDRSWYITGYDGARYILRRIRPPDLRQGRPWVGTL